MNKEERERRIRAWISRVKQDITSLDENAMFLGLVKIERMDLRLLAKRLNSMADDAPTVEKAVLVDD